MCIYQIIWTVMLIINNIIPGNTEEWFLSPTENN